MHITISVDILGLVGLNTKLDALLTAIDKLFTEVHLHMAAIDDALNLLTAQVEASTTVEASAVTAFQGFAAQFAAAAGNPAQVTALATKMKVSADALAAAIVANTPAAP